MLHSYTILINLSSCLDRQLSAKIHYCRAMALRVGIDLVNITRFKESARRGGTAFFDRIFTQAELAGDPTVESLAGMFAVKEAALKALDLAPGSWRDIEVKKDERGRPALTLAHPHGETKSQDVSISHDGDFAVAVACFEV